MSLDFLLQRWYFSLQFFNSRCERISRHPVISFLAHGARLRIVRLLPFQKLLVRIKQGDKVLSNLRALRAAEGIGRAGEQSVEGIVILVAHWIGLVIVTPSAGQSKAHESTPRAVDDVTNFHVAV